MAEERQERKDREQAETYDDAALKTDWRGPSLVFTLFIPAHPSGPDRPRYRDWDRPWVRTPFQGRTPHFRDGHKRHNARGLPEEGVCRTPCPPRSHSHLLPFGDGSIDHVISTGVFQFFSDLNGVFGEVARILPEGGRLAFVTGNRSPEGPAEIVAGTEQTGTEESLTMFRHTPGQVTCWLVKNGFRLAASVEFTIRIDEEHTQEFPARAYLPEKCSSIHEE